MTDNPQATVEERVARHLASKDWGDHNAPWASDPNGAFCSHYLAAAREVIALVQAAPADRAAILREAIDVAREEGHRLEEVAGIEPARGARCVAYLLRKLLAKTQPTELRRMADGAQQPETQAEPESLPLLFWDEPAGVVHEDGRITVWLSRAVNLAQSVPAGQLVLRAESADRLRRALTTALNDANEAAAVSQPGKEATS